VSVPSPVRVTTGKYGIGMKTMMLETKLNKTMPRYPSSWPKVKRDSLMTNNLTYYHNYLCNRDLKHCGKIMFTTEAGLQRHRIMVQRKKMQSLFTS
jgi:hypothetical protein